MRLKVKEMVPGTKKRCPGCGTGISFAGDDGRKTQRALDNLEKGIKNLFK
jgi:hypothetical protein